MKKNIFIVSLILLFTTSCFSQNTSSRIQKEDPAMLSKLQGIWMSTNPGNREPWVKVQISGNVCKVWMSSPKTGHWNDGASYNDPTFCDITGCYKITDRNEYDGKLQSESLALTIRRRTGDVGYTLNLHLQGGQKYLRIMDENQTSWTVCRKVSANYSPWK